MSQPTPYVPDYSFTDFSAGLPNSQPPGIPLDNQFAAIAQTLNEVCLSIAAIQRDDLNLRNQSVGVDQVNDILMALIGLDGFQITGPWLTAHAYIPGDLLTFGSALYLTTIAHTSGVFATDLAAVKFVKVFDADLLALETSLALPTGATKIGVAGGGTLQTFINSIPALFAVFSLATGAAGIGTARAETGAVPTTVEKKLREFKSVIDFGAVGDGTTDDTAAFNKALLTGGDVWAPSGYTYKINSTVTMGVDGTRLLVGAGSTISLQSAITIGISMSGSNCRIEGAGRILSPAQWNGANARSTYGTIWVTGNYNQVLGVTLENIPRVGVMFEECTNGLVMGVTLIGNYPYASYNPATTTGHAGIEYNPPTTAGTTTPTGNGSLRVVGCRIESSIQGFLLGNYGGADNEVGIVITGTNFSRCWNHGVYSENGRGFTLGSCNFTNCQDAIVADGRGFTLSNCTVYNDETTLTNGSALVYLRQPTDATISNLTITGLGAALYMDVIDPALGVAVSRNTVDNVTIRRTGAYSSTSSAFRLGLAAQECNDNNISNMTISGVPGTFAANVGAMELEMAAGFRGLRNSFTNVKVLYDGVLTATGQIFAALRHDFLSLNNVSLSSTSTAAAPQVMQFVFLDDCQYPEIDNVKFYFTSGGTNITARGIQINTTFVGGTAWNNKFFFTAAGLAAKQQIDNVGNAIDLQNNILDPASKLSGSITWLSGASSFDIANGNLLAAFSRATFTPTNNNAANDIAVATKGIKSVITDGHMTLSTADGSAIAGNATFDYIIR